MGQNQRKELVLTTLLLLQIFSIVNILLLLVSILATIVSITTPTPKIRFNDIAALLLPSA
jgi:hypothetical protein